MTNDYSSLQERVGIILQGVDPIGLIDGGAPPDEYDSEAAPIAPLLEKADSQDVLEKDLRAFFSEHFGDEVGVFERYTRLVRLLWKLK